MIKSSPKRTNIFKHLRNASLNFRFALIFTTNGKKLQQRFNTNLQAMFVNDVLKEKPCAF